MKRGVRGIFRKEKILSSVPSADSNDAASSLPSDEGAAAAARSNSNHDVIDLGVFKTNAATTSSPSSPMEPSSSSRVRRTAARADGSVDGSSSVQQQRERPSYRTSYQREEEEDDGSRGFDESDLVSPSSSRGGRDATTDNNAGLSHSTHKAKLIETSAGTNRLNRILSKSSSGDEDSNMRYLSGLYGLGESQRGIMDPAGDDDDIAGGGGKLERVGDPQNLQIVSDFCSRIVLPPLKVDSSSIGGSLLENYPDTMVQETLLVFRCHAFESSGLETVSLSALQYPADYAKHKRSLGLFGGGMGSVKSRHKLRYVMIARSTNKPLFPTADGLKYRRPVNMEQGLRNDGDSDDDSKADYDAMFADDEDMSHAMSDSGLLNVSIATDQVDNTLNAAAKKKEVSENEQDPEEPRQTTATMSFRDGQAQVDAVEEEVSSFPALICMTLQADGTAPDIRKLLPLDQLTTVQDVNATTIQLAFSNGDTVRIDFGREKEEEKAEAFLDKERFIWSLLQVHAMLCVSVVERNSLETSTADRKFLPPLNVRNLDRAELQYVATVNGFVKESKVICKLLDRQREIVSEDEDRARGEGKVDMEEMDSLAYDLMMGNFNTRISLFHTEEERLDAEEILNSTEWTSSLSKEETAAVSVAEKLGLRLQSRMRELEAETCRRLIAWEDEKKQSASGKAKLFSSMDKRDTVDALALASLFKTLESLDSELRSMEDWLQERAAAIKPLTDDCADIEEENRQLEQQWKSYDMLGNELRRLLKSSDLDPETERVLKNPAAALVYDEDRNVDIDESEAGIEEIYQAGKKLQEAIDFPKKCGALHLNAVAEQAEKLTSVSKSFCTALAHIIVTVMEQSKSEVVAGSDYGKVSKNDTHTMISKKVRDTQKKFQSAVLGYMKLIEVLSALSPDMLPAIRDAYSEMVSEGILMKKRMKGYFQALPGKNAAYMYRSGKDLKDYSVFPDIPPGETVNAPDIKAALSEMLPVIAREAYFMSAVFGSTRPDMDGREKKRNFEAVRKAVDNASQHFRYYINRTCGIPAVDSGKGPEDGILRSDPLLCLVASIYLNEAMDNYVDREKKGGDHSLSLAYVRATILDLRKKADKQWVIWVDKQIEWIRSLDGVPLSGKRAGIFPSFARFPRYLDHITLCCREGRTEDYFPDVANIKVISYYLQKMAGALLDSLKECAARESTDHQYASNVMQMENSYHFTQALKERGRPISDLFSKQVSMANAICKESTDSYLGWMIKREFVALHEFFSKISKTRKEQGDREVINTVPKVMYTRTLAKEANRDVLKEKIAAMYSRMEKHLSEEGGLLPVAWKALVKVLYEWFGRWEKLSTSLYQHKMNPSSVDIVRIAKAAGGASSGKPRTPGNEPGLKSILALGNTKNG